MPLDANKVRAHREALKLTQAEAAERAGIPRSHWALIESGRRPNPAITTAQRIAAALRIGIDRLLADLE